MRLSLLGGSAAAFVLALVTGARAQTAGDINRLNAAIQICNSPAGATMAECAKLRGPAENVDQPDLVNSEVVPPHLALFT